MGYKRQDVTKWIILALRQLGGQGTREVIKDTMSNLDDALTSEDIYFEVISKKTQSSYRPFNFDFNFGIQSLKAAEYIQPFTRMSKFSEITLTERGRTADIDKYPTADDKKNIDNYWEEKKKLNNIKQKVITDKPEKVITKPKETDLDTSINDGSDDDIEKWKDALLESLKQFSSDKFESFSRLLVSKMGVKMDKEKGLKLSGDGGIDGFGYFESDEFRTSRVAIQSKRYTTNSVSSPDIDKFKGAMDKYGAEYGIFITTSYFTDAAIQASRQGSHLITLINGDRITNLVEDYKLHVSPVVTYELDDYYFEVD